MATTPEQMQQQWMAEMMRRQQMEQQWAAQQGAYSGLPGAPSMPSMPVVAAQQPAQQTMEEAMRQRYAAAQQQYAQPDVWRPQTQPQPVPMPIGNEQMQYAGGTPGFYQQPQQRWGAVAGQQYTPEQQAALQRQAEEHWRQQQMRQPGEMRQPGGAPVPMPVVGGGEQIMRPAVQPSPDMGRQQMEQEWMKQQGAYSGRAGAPVPMPVMGGQRGLQNAYSRGARGAGLINQMNAREQRPQDAYAGQGLTDEQRQVAQANEASIQAQRPNAVGPAAAQQPAVPTQKWAEEKYNAPAAGTPGATGDEMFTKMKTMYEQKQPQLPTV